MVSKLKVDKIWQLQVCTYLYLFKFSIDITLIWLNGQSSYMAKGIYTWVITTCTVNWNVWQKSTNTVISQQHCISIIIIHYIILFIFW